MPFLNSFLKKKNQFVFILCVSFVCLYLNHLFLEKQFLSFFFKRLRVNSTDRYTNEFPYLSLCGRERNYIRCDDLPIVFTEVVHQPDHSTQLLSYGNAGKACTVLFDPHKICMLPWTGRIYHPAPGLAGDIGLVKSSIAIEWSRLFEFEKSDLEQVEPPTYFTWQDKKYKLTNELIDTATTHRQTHEIEQI